MRRSLYTLGVTFILFSVGGAAFWQWSKKVEQALPHKEAKMELLGPVFKPAEGKAPKKLVVVLHGYGADAENLWPVGYEISKALPEAEVLVPNGFDPCEGSVGGRQWFKMGRWTLPEWRAQLAQTKTRFDAYLMPILSELHLSIKDVAFVGFSQGGMMALHFGILYGIQAVVCFSGVFVDPNVLDQSPSLPHILLVHGDSDPVIPPKAFFQAQEILRAQNAPFEASMQPNLDHSINVDGLQRACLFLKQYIAISPQ
ncbi:MAG: dienelactone hydrolase family protein [Holosporales bacterium]|nr:dienelactone hydrolase family protein [Holosporales bacterium]